MRDDFERYLEEQLKDPEFRKEYEALEPEYTIMQAMIDARTSKGLTQKPSNREQERKVSFNPYLMQLL